MHQSCGLSQRGGRPDFGTGEKSFEKYESGEIEPSGPTKRLLKLAMERPELFQKPARGQSSMPSASDAELVPRHCARGVDRIYDRLFAASIDGRGQALA